MQKKATKPPAKTAKKKKPPVKKQDQKFSLKRLIMGEEKPDLTELEAGSTTILDILSPTTIDTKSRDYIVVDGIFHAYLYVAGYGYSTTVGSCWLAPLVEAGEGVNLLYNRSPVFLDPFDDYKYTNGNCWIGGSSGAGKTFTLQCLGGRLRQQGKRVIFIVPKKGHEFRPLCELLGGLYLRLSPSSRDCPNVMAIRRRSLDSYSGLRDMAARDDSVLPIRSPG